MKYTEDAKKIWKIFVPKYGQSDTKQGELLRAVEKIRDQNIRNGNCSWDENFNILISYLEKHLLDRRVFSEWKIKKTKKILERLKDFEFPYTKDDLYDTLADRVVEYYFFYGSKPHEKNENLKR